MAAQPGCPCSICGSDDPQQLNQSDRSLRDRIAAALWSTGWAVHTHGTEQGDGLACQERLVDGHLRGECYWKQADAVIAELGLRREDNEADFTGPYRHRYVTDWKADDE